MDLALFTPDAYIWPVLRNFEVFIASLAAAAAPAEHAGESALYPAAPRFVPDLHGRNPLLDARLLELHRELYSGLLRPSSFFDREQRDFGELFLPDLLGTPVASLLDCFMYCFLRQPLTGLPARTGISVLRAVFFSHESAEPHLWLHFARQRLAPLADNLPEFSCELELPAASRLGPLSLCVTVDHHAAPLGSGRFWGTVERHPDGRLVAQLSCCIDPATAEPQALEQAAPRLRRELGEVLRAVLGTAERTAA